MRGAKIKMCEYKLNTKQEEYVLNATWWKNLQNSINSIEQDKD